MANSDNKKNPLLSKTNIPASDSDASLETNSLSADSGTEQNQTNQNDKRKKKNRKGSEWEIIEGLKDGQRFENKPILFNGYLHKKRKWPLKGWHKRYFILDRGMLVYGKGPTDINKGKIHGSLDIGLSVISTKESRRRIDIDAEECIYHLKAKADETFSSWVYQLTSHRLYRQHELTYGTNISSLFKASDGIHSSIPRTPEIVSRDGSLTRGMKAPTGNGSRLTLWLQESLTTLEQFQRDAVGIDQNVTKLNKILQQMECNHMFSLENTCEAALSNVKKDRRKFGLKKKKSSKGGSVDLSIQFSKSSTSGTDIDNTSPLSANSFIGVSTSHQQVNTLGTITTTTLPVPIQASSAPASENISNLDAISLFTENQLREDFLSFAKSEYKLIRNKPCEIKNEMKISQDYVIYDQVDFLYAILKALCSIKSLTCGLSNERERLKSALENEAQVNYNHNIFKLKNNLSQVLQQNLDLKSRLLKIHEASDLTGLSSLDYVTDRRPYTTSLSYSSSCVSATEYFDAEDLPTDKSTTYQYDEEDIKDDESEVRTRSESSSEGGSLSSGDGSISSESELDTDLINPDTCLETRELTDKGLTGRRTILPVSRPRTEGLSLWNLLSRNIGKDLSQISMPVALNEPLNVLQRLCEELEYSELLDQAASIDDPYERMVHIAAFAVSGYASTLTRAGNKPFNPLLGETYECIREDKGFRFISEQVSHHPPISVCYAESPNFTFWQDARVKTKFWGKSMEFQPLGNVHVLLPNTGDLYSWNKVTTCVHNLFSNQRWVDQYGELKVDNGRITCKLTFSKASYWSTKRHEIVGAVFDESGKPVRRLFGKWSESLYCGMAPSARCIWRAGNLPPNHDHYYGFTRFAIELNELGTDAAFLPPTDTRFRPDQRALEEGNLSTAECLKLQLENAQRDRRKRREELNLYYEPRWFSNPQCEEWEYNGKYWEMRKNPGFSNLQFESLW